MLLAAARGRGGRDPWWVLREPGGRLDELRADDRRSCSRFAEWFAGEREAALAAGIERADRPGRSSRTGYDLAVLALPGGQRRLANVRKLMRLGREYEAAQGRDLAGSSSWSRGRAGEAGRGDPRESEAPVEGEALDAVRLMTIHRAKGLEFPIVCVADLGRGPWRARRADPGRPRRPPRAAARRGPGPASRGRRSHYEALGDEQHAAEEARGAAAVLRRDDARPGAADPERRGEARGVAAAGRAPIGVARAGARSGRRRARGRAAIGGDRSSASASSSCAGTIDSAGRAGSCGADAPVGPADPRRAAGAAAARAAGPPVAALSYSALGEYPRCGYRFYAERVLGLPPGPERPGGRP